MNLGDSFAEGYEVNMGTLNSKASENIVLKPDSFDLGSNEEVVCEL